MNDASLKELQFIKEHLEFLKNRLASLTEQVQQLEHRVKAESSAPTAATAQPVVPPPAVPRPSTQPVLPAAAAEPARPLVEATTKGTGPCPTHPKQPVRWLCAKCQKPLCELCGATAFQGRVTCRPCESAQPMAAAVSVRVPKPKTEESLETRIGRDWLNRVGVTSLILGVAYFILYSFQYLGPVAKLAIGFAVASGLIGAGVWLERREPFRWVARGLIGGGWALLYFTTYAMHHIHAVRVVGSALVDLVLLALVAAGAVWHSLRYRSQTITALALLLGFLTSVISDVSYFTLTSSVLLVVALAWLVVKMRWDSLYVYGVIASYATHLFWVNKQIALSPIIAPPLSDVAHAQFWLNASFVALYWVVYNLALFALDERDVTRRNRLLTATLVNSGLFVYIILSAMSHLFQEARYLVLLGVGAAYWLSEPVARRRQLPTIATAHLLIGLTFITLAIPLKFTGRWLSFLWTAEVASLVWLGLRYNRWPYRVFAMAWGLIIFCRLWSVDLWTTQAIAVWHWMVPWRVVMGGVGIASFGAAAWWYRSPRFSSVLRPIESPAFHLYFTAAAVLLWTLTFLEAGKPWIAAAVALEAAGIVVLGLYLKEPFVRILGAVGFGLSGLQLLSELGSWNPWAESIVAGLLYGMSGLYRSSWGQRAGVSPRGRHVYAVAASVVLTMLLHSEVKGQWLGVAWAVESAVLVAAGFRLKDRVLRMCGLGVSVLLSLLLLSDFLGALAGSQGTPQWRFATTSWVIAILYAISGLYRSKRTAFVGEAEQRLADLYTLSASGILTALLWLEVASKWLSVAWAVEGLALIGAGFALRDRIFRLCGLWVFGFLVLKILFVDLAGAETIYRILSFIVAGVMLLAASLAYAKFSAKAPK